MKAEVARCGESTRARPRNSDGAGATMLNDPKMSGSFALPLPPKLFVAVLFSFSLAVNLILFKLSATQC